MATMQVVIPVHDMAAHLEACLELLTPQLAPGDVVTVIDDRSSDGPAEVARRHQASVVALERGSGPYVARHLGISQADTDYLLFVDARCRPRPGLVDAHRALLADRNVALSCTGMQVQATGGLAAALAAKSGIFRVETRSVAGRLLNFFPTANLGVRRSAYRAVGGFRANMVSGGDADLCWRIQLCGQGRLAVDDRVLMEWVPRESMSALIRQWQKYGESTALLERLYPNDGASGLEDPVASAGPLRVVRKAMRQPGEAPLQGLIKALDLARRRQYLRALRQPFDAANHPPLGHLEEPAVDVS